MIGLLLHTASLSAMGNSNTLPTFYQQSEGFKQNVSGTCDFWWVPTLTVRTRGCAMTHKATASVRPAALQGHPLHKQQPLLIRMPLAFENSQLGDFSHRHIVFFLLSYL